MGRNGSTPSQLAEDQLYDNGTSGLTATSPQEAIDELAMWTHQPLTLAAGIDTRVTLTNQELNIDFTGLGGGGGGITSVNGDAGPVIVLDTGDIAEGTNLYYSDGRVALAPSVVALQGQAHDLLTLAAGSDPALALVGQELTLTLPTAPVASVNGATGVVVLDTADIAENTNLYYTEARVSANASVTALQAQAHDAATLAAGNDAALTLTGQEFDLTLPASIGTALQPGDNVSVLTNDAGYAPAFAHVGTAFPAITADNQAFYEITGFINTTVNGFIKWRYDADLDAWLTEPEAWIFARDGTININDFIYTYGDVGLTGRRGLSALLGDIPGSRVVFAATAVSRTNDTTPIRIQARNHISGGNAGFFDLPNTQAIGNSGSNWAASFKTNVNSSGPLTVRYLAGPVLNDLSVTLYISTRIDA